MRKTLYTLFAVLGLCMFAGCGSSSKGDDASPLAKQLVGEWHLVSWNRRIRCLRVVRFG